MLLVLTKGPRRMGRAIERRMGRAVDVHGLFTTIPTGRGFRPVRVKAALPARIFSHYRCLYVRHA